MDLLEDSRGWVCEVRVRNQMDAGAIAELPQDRRVVASDGGRDRTAGEIVGSSVQLQSVTRCPLVPDWDTSPLARAISCLYGQ